MGPFPVSDGHDLPRLIDELVPGLTAVGDDFVIGFEDPIGQLIVAQELPDILDQIDFGGSWRQGQKRDVFGNRELFRGVPSGLVEEEDSMGARYHLG